MRLLLRQSLLSFQHLSFIFLLPVSRALSNLNSFSTTALVTGSTDGIGLTTAKNLAAKGIHVLIHGRDEKRINAAVETVRSFQRHTSASSSQVLPLPPRDLASISECEQLAQDVRSICEQQELHLQILMNNAGVYAEELHVTPEGLELTLAVNVVAPFVITSLLLDKLLERNSRIVIASSISQSGRIRDWDDLAYSNRRYSSHAAYSESKLLDAMLGMEFADRLQKAGYPPDRITCNSLDPGTVNTKMLLAGWGPCGIDVDSALDETWLCTSDHVEGVSGKYFTNRSARRGSGSYDEEERAKLWQLLTQLAPEASAKWNAL
jgi:NAD(P)-dependent dehydrogenase (short-subunit alcohol dehydrogenase family)